MDIQDLSNTLPKTRTYVPYKRCFHCGATNIVRESYSCGPTEEVCVSCARVQPKSTIEPCSHCGAKLTALVAECPACGGTLL